MHMLVLKRYMARFLVKSGCQKDTHHDEVGLCAQTKDTILGSYLTQSGGPMWPLREKEESSFWPLRTLPSQLWRWHLKQQPSSSTISWVNETMHNLIQRPYTEMAVSVIGPYTLWWWICIRVRIQETQDPKQPLHELHLQTQDWISQMR